ncbi:hypothetical protein N2152v2_005685 [Parachlorella kessleri]
MSNLVNKVKEALTPRSKKKNEAFAPDSEKYPGSTRFADEPTGYSGAATATAPAVGTAAGQDSAGVASHAYGSSSVEQRTEQAAFEEAAVTGRPAAAETVTTAVAAPAAKTTQGQPTVCKQEFYTEVEDRYIIIEKRERFLEHRPVEKEYVVETRSTGMEQEMGRTEEHIGTKLAALQTWLRSIGLTDWDLQQQWATGLQPQLLQRTLRELKSPGGHLDPGKRERRSWYPRDMLEGLELHAGGLPAAVRLLEEAPSLRDHRRYNPVVFAEVAHRLKGLGCSPEDIRAVLRKQPALFTPSGFLRKSSPHSWELLEYLVKVLGHDPRHLLCNRLALLKSRFVRLPEVQRRVAFMELKGLDVHRKQLFWARQSPAGFCKELGFSREEYAAFKASVKAGQAGAGIAPTGAGNGTAGSSGSQSGAGSPAGHRSSATSSPALEYDETVNGAAASEGGTSRLFKRNNGIGAKVPDGKSRAAAVIAALRNHGRRRDTG